MKNIQTLTSTIPKSINLIMTGRFIVEYLLGLLNFCKVCIVSVYLSGRKSFFRQ